MIGLLTTVAFASPEDDALRAHLSEALSTEVPAAYFCVARPSLPEPFVSGLAAVGVKVKGVGCRLKGVVVGDRFVESEKGLAAAIGAGAWAGLDSEGKKAAVLNYTQSVLLAFDTPDPAEDASLDVKKGGHVVSHQFWRRVPEPMTASHMTGRWVFDAQAELTESKTEEGEKVQTRFLMEDAGTKGISVDEVSKALALRGKPIKGCYQAAWRKDLTIRGKARMSWDVADGKATNLKAKGDGSTALLKCYANGIGQVEFPPEAKGQVEWVFVIAPVSAD